MFSRPASGETVTVTEAVALVPFVAVAVAVNVVVEVSGLVCTFPPAGGETGPIPLSMVTELALGEVHVKVVVPPGKTDCGLAVSVMKLTLIVTAAVTGVPSPPTAVAV